VPTEAGDEGEVGWQSPELRLMFFNITEQLLVILGLGSGSLDLVFLGVVQLLFFFIFRNLLLCLAFALGSQSTELLSESSFPFSPELIPDSSSGLVPDSLEDRLSEEADIVQI